MDDADESNRIRIGTVTRSAYAADGDLSAQASTTTRYPSKCSILSYDARRALIDAERERSSIRVNSWQEIRRRRSWWLSDSDMSAQVSTTHHYPTSKRKHVFMDNATDESNHVHIETVTAKAPSMRRQDEPRHTADTNPMVTSIRYSDPPVQLWSVPRDVLEDCSVLGMPYKLKQQSLAHEPGSYPDIAPHPLWPTKRTYKHVATKSRSHMATEPTIQQTRRYRG